MDNKAFEKYTRFQRRPLEIHQRQNTPLREQYPIKEKDLNQPIHVLDLGAHAERLFLQHDIATIQDFSYHSHNTLLSIKGMGTKSAQHIINQYVRYVLR